MPKKRIHRRRRKPRAVDLFSGCGGLTLGLKQAGFNVIGAVEIDSIATETYAKNHPEVKLFQKDIRKLTGKKIRRTLRIKKGRLELLAGCPPCQGFSTMRTKNGKRRVRDKRNDLVYEFLRLVRALLPKTVMMENVPKLAKNKRMKELQKGLKSLGYDLNGTPIILNTADFGVPQRRKRVILICSRVGKIKLPKHAVEKNTVRNAIGKMPTPGNSGDPLHDRKEKRDSKTIDLFKLIPKNGGSRADLPKKFQLPCHRKPTIGFRDVYGRMKWDDVAPTITSGCVNPSKGRFLHPTKNRAITLREAALLQTFPRNYFFSLKGGKEATALMIGNALPPAFIKIHALSIKSLLRA